MKQPQKITIYLFSFLMAVNFTVPVFAAFCESEYGLDAAQVTFLFAIFSLTVFLFEIPTGIICDKIGEKLALIIGSALTVAATILFISGSTTLLYLGEFIFALGYTFFSGPYDSIIYKYCKASDGKLDYDTVISKSYSLQWFALSFSFLGCFFISEIAPLKTVFIATLIANLLLLILAIFLPKVANLEKQNRSFSLIVSSYKTEIITNRKLLKACILNVAFLTILVSGYQILQAYLMSAEMNQSYNGLLYFVAAIFASCGSFFYKKLKTIFKSFLLLSGIGLLIIAFCMFGLSITTEIVPIFIFVCLFRLIWGVTSPMFSSMVNQSIKSDNVRNTAFSFISLLSNLCNSLLLFAFSIINCDAKI